MKLTERERQAYALNKVLGYSQRETGKMMGITACTVGQYVENAKRKILGATN